MAATIAAPLTTAFPEAVVRTADQKPFGEHIQAVVHTSTFHSDRSTAIPVSHQATSFSELSDFVRQPSKSSMVDSSEKPMECSQQVQLTQAQVLTLLSELMEGFSSPNFQEELHALTKSSNSHKLAGRMQLALKVQSLVLPKYRLPGTSGGVLMMMRAVAPHLGNWMVSKLVGEIDETLGLPMGTTCSSCIDLHDARLEAFEGISRQISINSDTTTCCSENDIPCIVAAKGSVRLTRKQILLMANELLEGFSTPKFQEKLHELLGNRRNKRDVPGRMELALTVQSKVLPKYGMPGTWEGVVMMMDAVAPHMGDWMVQHMLWMIDDKLGVVP